MNDYARNDAIDRPVYLNNESTPGAAFFGGIALPAPLLELAPSLAQAPAPPSGGLYYNWTMTMSILKKTRISTEREMITRGHENH